MPRPAILVIEDEDKYRRVIGLHLSSAYDVKAAGTAEDGLKLAADVDTMKKQQAAATTDEAKAKLLREIDLKEKALNSRAEEAQTAYNAEWQEGLAGVAQKIAATMKKYAADSGFTLLLDVSSQQSNVLWAVPQTDISQAVVDLYNKQSGIAAPVVQAPRAAAPKPTTAAPKPAAPAAKPPVK